MARHFFYWVIFTVAKGIKLAPNVFHCPFDCCWWWEYVSSFFFKLMFFFLHSVGDVYINLRVVYIKYHSNVFEFWYFNLIQTFQSRTNNNDEKNTWKNKILYSIIYIICCGILKISFRCWRRAHRLWRHCMCLTDSNNFQHSVEF